jgi:hypothetical protein
MALLRMYFSSGITRLNIGYAISEDNGVTWTPPSYIFETNRDYIHTFGVSCADSVINIVFYDDWGPDNAFYSIRSTNFGQNWSQPIRMFGVLESERRDCASFDSMVHLSWEGRFDISEQVDVYYSRSTDQGNTWSPNIALSVIDQFHSQLQAICIDGMGRPKVSWMDYKDSPYFATGDIFLRASADSGSSWGPERQITFNHLAQMSDIAQSGDTVAIIWEDNRPENGRGGIYCSISLDDGEAWNEPDRLDADTCLSINPSVAASNSRVYAIWQEGRFSQDSNGVFFSCWREEPDAVDERDVSTLPNEINLAAYPNPFNSSVVIAYSASKGGDIEIINSLGQIIRKFDVEASIDGKVVWDGANEAGHQAASGTYFAKLSSGEQSREMKLIYLK